VALWLRAHLTAEQLRDLAVEAGYRPESWRREHPESIPYELSQRMRPEQLLDAWRHVTAPSDLTDAELELLAPYLPRRLGWNEEMIREHAHRSINGWRYQRATGCAWSKIPIHYGTGSGLYAKWCLWRSDGVFDRMLAGVRGQERAARLVEWLEPMVRK
jgi:transposase